MEIIFASSNPNKLREITSICPQEWTIRSMAEAGFKGELPETRETIEGNSLQKAETLYNILKKKCFAEDTGLEIEALNGAPGVLTARFAGTGCAAEDNWKKVLTLLKDFPNRKARFKTIITYFDNGAWQQFEGICPGSIAHAPKGNDGFGYDPVFIPDGSLQTFAEMDLTEKNTYSHRKKAFDRFATFLHSLSSLTKEY